MNRIVKYILQSSFITFLFCFQYFLQCLCFNLINKKNEIIDIGEQTREQKKKSGLDKSGEQEIEKKEENFFQFSIFSFLQTHYKTHS